MSTTSEATVTAATSPAPDTVISGPLTVLFAISVGVIVTNLFASQTLVGLIAPSLGMAAASGGLVAMATLLGYAAGLFLLVPLADLLENRALVVRMLGFATLAAGAAAAAPTPTVLLALLFVLGAACSAIQILVPIAASMAPPERRGRVIGDVMSGLMIGILLSRPLASFIADAFGWRAFYASTAALMAVLTIVLVRRLSEHRPAAHSNHLANYPALIASLWHLLRGEPLLRLRALTASLSMAAFSLFWTSVALRLAQPPFDLSQRDIALFALAGAGGAVVTPLAGRAGDRGWSRPLTIAAHVVIVAAFVLAAWAGTSEFAARLVPLLLMGVSAIVLDVGVIGDQTFGRRAINLLKPEARGRLNGLFVGLFFLGGAFGSAVAGFAWVSGGWQMICMIGAAFAIASLLVDYVGRST
ncbi:MAG: MFS transporter [Beijerinckiaceae bacterium]